ncbi:hypothetical protein K3495_g11605 [Podosphaera aphanis]|nr:hypothetical protein K3495_g11605 [Podosphaera aphanis]
MENPQQLPFAPYVKKHALISTLNRGLLYNMHERKQVALQQQRELSAEPTLGATMAAGIFGPLTPPLPSPASDEKTASSRKHNIQLGLALDLSNSEVKKPRLGNGYANNQVYANEFLGSAMELDALENEQAHAYPSPEQVSTPRTAIVTSGPEKGTQVDRVHDLTNHTIFLKLSENPTTNSAILTYCAFHPRDPNVLAAAGSDALARVCAILTYCAFHPRDPNVLAAAGSDALARVWSLESLSFPSDSTTAAEISNKPISANHRNLHHFRVPATTQASALSWAPHGQYLAIASQPPDMGLARVDFWGDDACLVSSNTGIESPVIGLEWNFSGTACLIISPRNNASDTSITVIYPAHDTSIGYILFGHNLIKQLLEVVWTSDTEFIICGGDLLQTFHCSTNPTVIKQGKKYDVAENTILSQVAYDKDFNLLATASESGKIHIWGHDGQSRTLEGHQGLINLLAWQPGSTTSNNERLLVSCGEDGVINIWNVLSLDPKIKARVTLRSAVSALSFSPDGSLLAGATADNIFIWKVNNFHIPTAVWRRQTESGWQTPQSSESTLGDEDICTLCWDCHGKRLALSNNNRLAVINVWL